MRNVLQRINDLQQNTQNQPEEHPSSVSADTPRYLRLIEVTPALPCT